MAIRSVWPNILLGLVAGVSVIASIVNAPGASGFLAAGFAVVMLAIAVIDYRSFIIPDWLIIIGFALAIVRAAAQEPTLIFQAIAVAAMRGIGLALFFLGLRIVYARLRGRQGLGLGDVKLALVAGAWLDWLMIPMAIELAAFAALTGYALQRVVRGQSIAATGRIPFGLFFAPAIWACWLLEAIWLRRF